MLKYLTKRHHSRERAGFIVYEAELPHTCIYRSLPQSHTKKYIVINISSHLGKKTSGKKRHDIKQQW